jgi:murein endopeptidase
MRGVLLFAAVSLAALIGCASAGACPLPGSPLGMPLGAPSILPSSAEAGSTAPPILWRRSVALGRPNHGRLQDGVQLPSDGPEWFTWDWGLRTAPNRDWRRWGTDRLLRAIFTVLDGYAAVYPDAARVGVADLSRPQGGHFGKEFGGLGHASHQNGLDVDVLYPRGDCLERPPMRPDQIDRPRAQALVDAFVEAGARYVFVGPHTGLRGPRRVVQSLGHHDNHMHVRIRPAG